MNATDTVLGLIRAPEGFGGASSNARLVLVVLAALSDDTGAARLPLSRIAEAAGVSKTTARRAARELVRRKLIRMGRIGEIGFQAGQEYIVLSRGARA